MVEIRASFFVLGCIKSRQIAKKHWKFVIEARYLSLTLEADPGFQKKGKGGRGGGGY